MAKVNRGNKNSATEDEIGLLHSMVTKIFKAKLANWIRLLELGGDVDIIVDMTQLNNVIKFIDAQGIVAVSSDDDKDSELSGEIEQIKKAQMARLNVVPFKEDEEDYHQYK